MAYAKPVKAIAVELGRACESGDLSRIENLLAMGADPNELDARGFLPLCLAAGHGGVEALSLLLSKGAILDGRDRESKMALHWACVGNAPCVEFLLEKGAKLDARCAPGRAAPIHVAIMESMDCSVTNKIVGMLLEFGAEMEGLDSKGSTPLLMAAARGLGQVVSELLDFGADIEAKNERTGETSLMLAASVGSAESVGKLLADGARVDPLDKDGWSALRHAAKAGSVKCCEFLMGAGAQHGELCVVGKSPVEAARENGHKDLADWLSCAKLASDEKSEIGKILEKAAPNQEPAPEKARQRKEKTRL